MKANPPIPKPLKPLTGAKLTPTTKSIQQAKKLMSTIMKKKFTILAILGSMLMTSCDSLHAPTQDEIDDLYRIISIIVDDESIK